MIESDCDPLAEAPHRGHTVSMNQSAARLLRTVPILIGMAAVTYFGWPKGPHPDNFWCVLQAKEGNQPHAFGLLHSQVTAVRITGLAVKQKVDSLFDLNGRATVIAGAKSVKGLVDGDIFIGKSGRPNGLLLWIKSNDIGSETLGVTTLNKDGMLDFSESEAFLHAGPNLGPSDRLSYPVTMNCRAKLSG